MLSTEDSKTCDLRSILFYNNKYRTYLNKIAIYIYTEDSNIGHLVTTTKPVYDIKIYI